MRKIALAFSAACLLAGCAYQVPSSETIASVEDTNENLRRILDERIPKSLREHAVPSAAVTFVRGGEVAFTAVYGEQSPGVPATERTLYNVASLTKPVVSEVVLRLVSDGLLSLDEPMSPHWIDPDIEGDPRHETLTPRIALTHQTGFKNWRYQTEGILQFEWDPGTQTGYSGEGFDYVVRFVESKLDTSFEALAQEYLFDPAGMQNTAFTGRDWFEGRLAWPYYPDSTWHEPRTWTEPSGADGLRTTSEDYARFLISVMNGEMVTEDIAAERLDLYSDLLDRECSSDEFDPAICPERAGFGLSWFIFTYEDETVVFHNGANNGERTLAFYVPERDLGIVVLTNGANGFQVIYEILDVLYDNDDWLTIMRP